MAQALLMVRPKSGLQASKRHNTSSWHIGGEPNVMDCALRLILSSINMFWFPRCCLLVSSACAAAALNNLIWWRPE